MTFIPSAIIFINSDFPQPDGYVDGYINDLTKYTLTTQLYINEVMTFKEFNNRVAVDPNYSNIVHLNKLRILVISPDFRDYTNRNLADVVVFYSHGMVSVMKSNYYPPNHTFPIERLNVYELLRANNSSFVVILPQNPPNPYTCGCCPKWGPGGIVGIELRAGDPCGIHSPNPDRECCNEDFINRK